MICFIVDVLWSRRDKLFFDFLLRAMISLELHVNFIMDLRNLTNNIITSFPFTGSPQSFQMVTGNDDGRVISNWHNKNVLQITTN